MGTLTTEWRDRRSLIADETVLRKREKRINLLLLCITECAHIYIYMYVKCIYEKTQRNRRNLLERESEYK